MTKTGASKQKKMNARVDFTPMVDMIMLLVTFFMLCTTLLKPQTMEIAMPSDKEDLKDEERNQAKASEAMTILLTGGDRLFYFEGKTENARENLKETQYGKGGNGDGIRNVLRAKNHVAYKKILDLKKEFETRDINENSKKEYKERLDEIKSEKGTPTVIIKAADEATYRNLIDILDEMSLCGVGKYVIDKFSESDKELLKEKGVKFEQ
ncbi:MAG: biopolymer transporter ExbD [Prevotellaceae bacterium]|nr:biopolymer transporter ExbD [Prevotellaceae bacterium]